MQKRLQVFVSSTYEDMRAEREAAIRAVLQAKHVPAGMEFFAAGSESQWDVIKQWIDACDVFLLILGGRYGSIEPKSGTGYIELEYDYAEQQAKQIFAIVMTDASIERKVQAMGRAAIETANGAKLSAFRDRVLTKMAGRCDDLKDIALEIFKALGEMVQKDTVFGWVSGSDAQRLQDALRVANAQLANVQSGKDSSKNEQQLSELRALVKILEAEKMPEELGGNLLAALNNNAALWMSGVTYRNGTLCSSAAPMLEVFRLVTREIVATTLRYRLNDFGKSVVTWLRAEAAGLNVGGP